MKNVDKLAQSKVVFDEAAHTYTLGDTKLSGITSIISRYLFPKKYDNVSEDIMEKSRMHGSMVHSQIQSIVNDKRTKAELAEYLDAAQQETKDFVQLMKDCCIKMIKSEYLVSDNLNVASNIDLIDVNYNLYDIKTTATLDTEYLRWQLSIYAFLFNMCNEENGIKAGKLYGIHLRDGKAKLVEVDRISDEIVNSLLNAYIFNEPEFVNPLNTLGDEEDSLIKELAEVRAKKEAYETREKDILSKIKRIMETNTSYSIKRDTWSVSRGKDSMRAKFDESKFKEDKPAMWAKYQTMSKVSGKFQVNIKDEYYNSLT